MSGSSALPGEGTLGPASETQLGLVNGPILRSLLSGFIPLGGIIATMPHLAGAYVCVATTAADASGFVLCNGQTLSDASSPMNGAVIPNINDDVFLMGTAGVTTGAQVGSNSRNLSHTHSVTSDVAVGNHADHTHNVSLVEENLPQHAHTINHDHGAVTSGNNSVGHTHSVSATTSGTNVSHTHTGTAASAGAHIHSIRMNANAGGPTPFNSVYPNPGTDGNVFPTGVPPGIAEGAHTHSVTTGAESTDHTHSFSTTSGGVSANHTHSVDLPNYTGSSGNGSGTGTAATSTGASATLAHTVTNNSVTSGSGLGVTDVRPKYIAVKYVMRVK